ncbi:MAG: tetratricopeptide repeat protein [Bacteroidales bacterium]
MKNIKILSFVLLLIIAFTGCKSAKNKSVEEITILEKELLSATAKMDSTKAQQLIDLYVKYANQFLTDSISPVYLLKAADISMNCMKPEMSISLLDRILLDYPKFSKLPDCLFLKAFIYENQNKDFDKAKLFYQEFLKKYPTHELAPSAKAAIDNLGIPLDALIKSFEAKNNAAKDSIKLK